MITYRYTSWPFKEAQRLYNRFKERPSKAVTFETGFGPSGMPHIGTFAEVARTTWVRHAFEFLTDWPTKLIVFSDDMDGLRKVPLNLPERDMLRKHVGKPLCQIPDPFGQHESYSDHMNNKLKEFLDTYGFRYEFRSSRDAYTRGDFDQGLAIILQNLQKIESIILPTLSGETQARWSPFFPICQKCGRVYSTRVVTYHPQYNAIEYVCDREDNGIQSCGHSGTTVIFGGRVKVGWKVDWALRWYCYDVDYEMYGKDLIESAQLSDRIVRIMGKQPPSHFTYEMFLDEEARKISKSVGEGFTIDAWVKYAPLESLLYFLFQNPRRAKRLFWDVVPKSVDDYLAELRDYPTVTSTERRDSAIWHIFGKGVGVPSYGMSINYSLISNLISALGTDDVGLTLEYLERYDPSARAYQVVLRDLVTKCIEYYRDFVLPNKEYRVPTGKERELLLALRDRLASYQGVDEEELQALPFEVARGFDVPPSTVFQAFYKAVLGQERGPRFSTFTLLMGKDMMIGLLDATLAGNTARSS